MLEDHDMRYVEKQREIVPTKLQFYTQQNYKPKQKIQYQENCSLGRNMKGSPLGRKGGTCQCLCVYKENMAFGN